ncbi:protein-tyrosine phosphatase family protein [Desulfovibrio ferrophilus]|uniref:Dual specificity protein phosphatase n=1 Tax=Desulfovibrio ferrophilus TaxID=241368 RepID=A0A2Z6B308_9BACT|nr:dual specificity protein phosphatase [Desulfovibrio ferrophilus]BBD09828.1 dual specificity protein phosphatase [Desulfovibrio ferrophilus]
MAKGKAYIPDWVTDQIAVGGAPMSYPALDALRAEGLDCILNLCAEFCDLKDYEEQSGFEVYYFPIPDEETPDLAELEKALEWMDEAIYLGKKVLIHCRHGIGRTGTVLNAYLLRKGLGHKLAGRKLKPLRAKPQNFAQWRFVRRYGKQEGRLTVREPSLEAKHLVDLYPFFADYERTVEDVDVLLQGACSGPCEHCGQDHDRCCFELVTLCFAEAVYIAHTINMVLDSAKRLEVIERGAAASKRIRQLGYTPENPDSLTASLWHGYSESRIRCPLSHEGQCLIYDSRPLNCRMSDLDSEQARHLAVTKFLPKTLRAISANLFFAYTSKFPDGRPPIFTLPDVVSGKFVQTFFHHLLRLS